MIKPINGWTKESMIEQLDKHLPKKGRCMSDSNFHCVYHRPSDGSRCAAGAFFPGDPETEVWFKQGGPVYHVIAAHPHLGKHMPLPTIAMENLQRAHDSAVEPRTQVRAWIENNVE